ncbi:MAG: penicillin-binding protein 1A [Micavibrio aeruginosavorus]|uniref:Penicillin-binding protein 1A n=1 Tax=Micavibrio aeruginosavorus TaxID=349221 RepID=A0A7T5R344_9BACT|nr:MAG: penicillin-binding protein 1A [Micavibrio aeruginosavorus]
MRFLTYLFLAVFSIGMLGVLAGVGTIIYAISYYGQDLPDYSQLKEYQPPVLTRLYAGDGRLMAEYAKEKRVFIPIDAIPDLLKNAFIAAEDQNFYVHEGVDFFAIANAAVGNLAHGGRPRGASTITQQVAKNFLLSPEATYKRKIREALLAFRMEKALSKDRLLELYLNEIYLGEGSYGVAAAALNYFNKPLEDLTIEEMAYLAALPKAPNNYNPERHAERATERRNWVIGRMQKDGYITAEQAETTKAKPLIVTRAENRPVDAPYFAEEVRRELAEKYGESSLYGGGLAVRTTVDPRLQETAERALQNGLMAYDRRWGWRGPVSTLPSLENWRDVLATTKRPDAMLTNWQLATVLDVSVDNATLGFADNGRGILPLKNVSWAKKRLEQGGFSAEPAAMRQVVNTGDIIMVEAAPEDGLKTTYALRQIPRVNGALVALDPHTGRVLAIQGGWSHKQSVFNRATQAKRQPGSAFKPFVYLTALEKGFTPATLILDAPIVIDQGPGMPKWRPSNYKGEYFGPTPLRVGVEKSRNLMTVRLAHFLGMESIIETVQKFGVVEKMEPHLAYSLGAGETTVLRMTTAYAQLVNGGKKITPTLIDRIQDRRGATIYRHDQRPCENCGPLLEWNNQYTPVIPDNREQLTDPRYAYQMVSILEGVVERGTAVKLKELGYPLAGKTGTTNESRDAWFVGFTPDLAVGVYVGFDSPESLGKRETGSSLSVPIFREFMETALKDVPPTPFRVPPGIKQVQINAATGALAQPGDSKLIWEAFLAGNEPSNQMFILDANGISNLPSLSSDITDSAATLGTGGIY